MKINKFVTIISALPLALGAVRAANIWQDPNGWVDEHLSYDASGPFFSAQEFSLDLFGSYSNPEGQFNELFKTSFNHGYWGGGAGANYFITRELGLGADFNVSSKPNDLRLVDQVTGSLIFRLPLWDSGIAPYLIGSGGRGISPQYEWVYGGGIGVELRPNPTTGLFSDVRFLWAEKTTADNRLLIRFGVRIVF